MYTDWLLYFNFTYQSRSYAAAAKRIPMTTTGLERAIHALEKELGVVLFERENSGALKPTAYADEFSRFTENWDFSRRMLQGSFERIRALERQEIRLGTAQGTLGMLGSDFLREFNKQHPGINVVYNETDDLTCDRALSEGMVDLALTVFPYDDSFVTEELMVVPLSLWVNKKNPLSKKDKLCFEDLGGQHLAMPGKGYKVFDMFTEICAERNIQFEAIHSMTELYRVYDFVLANEGLGYGNDKLAQVFTMNTDVVTIYLEEAQWRFGLSRSSAHQLSNIEQVFVDYCIRECSRYITGGINAESMVWGRISARHCGGLSAGDMQA
jgi:DNA-binding transcriptional LysR family regulator